jgi:hypothetical protein
VFILGALFRHGCSGITAPSLEICISPLEKGFEYPNLGSGRRSGYDGYPARQETCCKGMGLAVVFFITVVVSEIPLGFENIQLKHSLEQCSRIIPF